MKRKKTHQATSAAEPMYVAVEIVIGDEVCRVELSPATARRYEREARRRGLTVADLLHAAAGSVLAERGPLH